MSKMDNLRAMREAKYAEAQKRSADAPARPKAPVAPPAEAARKTLPPSSPPRRRQTARLPPRPSAATAT